MSKECQLDKPPFYQCCCTCIYHRPTFFHCSTTTNLQSCCCNIQNGWVCDSPESRLYTNWPEHSCGCELHTTKEQKMEWDKREEEQENKRDILLDLISDTVSNLLYYDRKEDDELPVGEIEKMIKRNEITVDEILWQFRDCLVKALK